MMTLWCGWPPPRKRNYTDGAERARALLLLPMCRSVCISVVVLCFSSTSSACILSFFFILSIRLIRDAARSNFVVVD